MLKRGSGAAGLEKIIIRQFNHKDIKGILKIESNSFPKSAYGRFTFFCLSKLYRFLVYDKDEILGYAIFNPGDGHIISIAVDPQHRRRGIGKKLMTEVFSQSETAWVEVRGSNKVA
jgi:ribosomal-protein-alanine N-acetyltransferase